MASTPPEIAITSNIKVASAIGPPPGPVMATNSENCPSFPPVPASRSITEALLRQAQGSSISNSQAAISMTCVHILFLPQASVAIQVRSI